MRILFVVDSLSAGGVENRVVHMANALAEDGITVSICVTRTATDLADRLRPEVGLYCLNRTKRFDRRALMHLADIVGSEEMDVIQVFHRSTLGLLVLMRSLRFIRTPIILYDQFGVVGVRRGIPLWLRLFPIWFQFWAKYQLAHYVAAYPELARWAETKGVPREKISLIERALDLSYIRESSPVDIRQELGISGHIAIGVVVANLWPRKGIEVLLDSLSQSTNLGDTQILIIGADRDLQYAAQCRDRCSQLGLDKNVRFLGKRSDVYGLLHTVDFALMPSRHETGPMVLVEYLAASLPVVSTAVGSIARRLNELGVQEFVPPDNSGAFAEALDRLFALSPAERRERGKQGQAVVSDHFEIRQILPKWLSIYNTVSRNQR